MLESVEQRQQREGAWRQLGLVYQRLNSQGRPLRGSHHAQQPQKSVLAQWPPAGFYLGIKARFDLGLACRPQQRSTEDEVICPARDPAPEMPALTLDLSCSEASRERGERSHDAEGFTCDHQAFFFTACRPDAAVAAGLTAGFSAGSALLLLFAGGFACERLAFNASIRLITLPRSGAAAMIGL